MTKEEIYDTQISPLIRQIIAICKQHKIANLCAFALENDGVDGMVWITSMTEEEFAPPQRLKDAVVAVNVKPRPVTVVTTERADGSKTCEAII